MKIRPSPYCLPSRNIQPFDTNRSAFGRTRTYETVEMFTKLWYNSRDIERKAVYLWPFRFQRT